ncbi:MAG: hypothetical protein ABIH90_01210 [Candidatus Aenigmatarchaeota archaeon]
MRGMDITVIGLVVFLGAAAVLSWTIYQVNIGSGRIGEIGSGIQTEKPFSQMENVKRVMIQDVLFSAHQASLIVASQGGSYVSQRYWMCNGQITIPTEAEVLFALSNTSSNLMRTYIDGINQEKDITVEGYDCLYPYDPGSDTCNQQNSAGCESFPASATNGKITVKGDGEVSYQDPLQGEVSPNRFFWIYHRLQNVFDKNQFVIWVNADVREHCTEPDTNAVKIANAIQTACERLKEEFDEYVDITCLNLCPEADMDCLNVPCDAPPVYETCLTDTGQRVNGAMNVQVSIKDNKYNIPGAGGAMQPLVWNIVIVSDVAGVEHRPVNRD